MLQKAEKSKLKNKEKQAALSHQLQTDVIPFGACLIFTPLFAEKKKKHLTRNTVFLRRIYTCTARRRKNYKIVYDPSMTVYHESGRRHEKEL